jgi:CTP synthase
MQILELPQDVHPFFLGTQAHPELTSRPLRPSPFFMGLIQAALEHVKGESKATKRQPQTV